MKKAASFSDRPKPSEIRQDGKGSPEIERKPVPAPTPVTPPAPPAPASAPQKQSGKKETGLFASIFGSKKKSQEPKEKSKGNDSPSVPNKSSARDRSQNQRNSTGGWGDGGNALMDAPTLNYYYTRFPIHVERAIYRLSHIKLANPRRPLLQQVLLSNFMYGYLNLINKAVQPAQQQQPQEIPQPQPLPQQHQQEMYDDDQSDDHVFYSQDDQNDYYQQDYYGSQYEDDQDDVHPTRRVLLMSSRCRTGMNPMITAMDPRRINLNHHHRQKALHLMAPLKVHTTTNPTIIPTADATIPRNRTMSLPVEVEEGQAHSSSAIHEVALSPSPPSQPEPHLVEEALPGPVAAVAFKMSLHIQGKDIIDTMEFIGNTQARAILAIGLRGTRHKGKKFAYPSNCNGTGIN